jgi:hypothetical protein
VHDVGRLVFDFETRRGLRRERGSPRLFDGEFDSAALYAL